MAWMIEFDVQAEKELDSLDPETAKRITKFLIWRVGLLDNPRSLGEALQGKGLDNSGSTVWAHIGFSARSKTLAY